MHAALTVRRLKPGGYDAWRKAWQPEEWPKGAQAAYILRNTSDPDEVIAFGFFEGDIGALRNDAALQDQMRRRVDAMAPHIEAIGADGVYEVVEVVKPG